LLQGKNLFAKPTSFLGSEDHICYWCILILGTCVVTHKKKGTLPTFRTPFKAYWASYESNYWVLRHSKVKIYTQNKLTLK
jgi:hypothetical protein